MNSRFPVLSTVSILLRVLGWFGLVIGVVFTIVMVGSDESRTVINMGSGFAIVLSSLITVALGEAIGVLFAIEQNTRAALSPHPAHHFGNQTSTHSPAESISQALPGALHKETAASITVSGQVYRSLQGTPGEAFCLGCRMISPKDKLYYDDKTGTFYHRECAPR